MISFRTPCCGRLENRALAARTARRQASRAAFSGFKTTFRTLSQNIPGVDTGPNARHSAIPRSAEQIRSLWRTARTVQVAGSPSLNRNRRSSLVRTSYVKLCHFVLYYGRSGQHRAVWYRWSDVMSTAPVGLPTHPFLTPDEVSDLLQVSVYTVRRWIKQGELPAYKVGRLWRIGKADLSHWLDQQRPSGGN